MRKCLLQYIVVDGVNNGGSARNRNLCVMTGDYFCFVLFYDVHISVYFSLLLS